MERAQGAQGGKARRADDAVRLAGFEPRRASIVGRAAYIERHPATHACSAKSFGDRKPARATPSPGRATATSQRIRAKDVANPTRNAIILEAEWRFRRHPDRLGATQKMSIFVTGKGTPFAIDTSAKSKQPIWAPANAVPGGALDDIPSETYPADRSRNSNLNVQGLKVGSALRRFYPGTAADASRIMDAIAS